MTPTALALQAARNATAKLGAAAHSKGRRLGGLARTTWQGSAARRAAAKRKLTAGRTLVVSRAKGAWLASAPRRAAARRWIAISL